MLFDSRVDLRLREDECDPARPDSTVSRRRTMSRRSMLQRTECSVCIYTYVYIYICLTPEKGHDPGFGNCGQRN